MQNEGAKRKAILSGLILILMVVLWVNLADPLSTNAQKPKETTEVEKADPSKDFSSLDNYLAYNNPEGWQKIDHVDEKEGKNTFISLSSPDFEASASGSVATGAKIWVSRKYDPLAEETLSKKFDEVYPLYDYNIREMIVDGKNAMSLHEDYRGHNRFVYVANSPYLWQITVATKDLAEEEKYWSAIENFLASIQFKD